MASNREALKIRAKMLGVLLRDARLANGKTPRECGEAIGVSAAVYRSLERGARAASIPQLELLAHFLDVPVSHFWNGELLSESGVAVGDREEFLADRQRDLATLIRVARKEAGLRLRDLARAAGISRAKLKAYEFGDKPIPLPELEAIATALNLTLDDFVQRDGPPGQWLLARRAVDRFAEPLPDVQSFVAETHNEPYLRLAMQLSSLPVERLRSVAEGLLDITF